MVLQGNKVSGLERHGRAKRPRETDMPETKQSSHMHLTQQSSHGTFPHLPDDLYDDNRQPSGLAGVHAQFSKPLSHVFLPSLPAGHLQQHAWQSLQPFAAIAAFRPETSSLLSSRHKPQSESDITAADDDCHYLTASRVESFTAALSANVESLRQQQQPCKSLDLPFPGMHTLDLSSPFAQPTVYEAMQQLMDRPAEFLCAATCCPLSQVCQPKQHAGCRS